MKKEVTELRKKLLTNLSLVETVEYLQLKDERINIRLIMISGREINNFYNDKELANNHYQDIKKVINNYMESL